VSQDSTVAQLTGHTLTSLWVQGLRRDTGPESDWRPILFARLTVRYWSLMTGAKTREAEQGLGLGTNCYFFIGRCEPEFGDEAVVFTPIPPTDGQATPFDTGGLWHGHIETDPPLKLTDLPAFVCNYSWASDGYHEDMSRWLQQAFPSVDCYTSGQVPSVSIVPEIQLKMGQSTRHWTWEARMLVAAITSTTVLPLAAILTAAQYDLFSTWVRRQRQYDAETRKGVLDLVRRIRVDPGDRAAGAFLNEILGQDA